MENKKVSQLKKTALLAGAALATTGAGIATQQNDAHADATAPATTQTQSDPAQQAVTQAGQTNASQEATLEQQNASDQEKINNIQSEAADVKAQHATEIADAQAQGQADYQSQADQINKTYDQQVADQQAKNKADEDAMAQANAQAVAKAQSDQQAAMAHAEQVKQQAQADFTKAQNDAQAKQSADTQAANQAYNTAQQQAATARDNAKQTAQDQYDQAVSQASQAKTTAATSAKTTYDNAVKAENDAYATNQGNAQAQHDQAIRDAQAKINNDQTNVTNKQNAYDNAVKNAPKISHNGTPAIGFSSDHTPTGMPNGPIPTNIGNLPLTPQLSAQGDTRDINYQENKDQSEKFTGTRQQVAQLSEYTAFLINQLAKQNGLPTVTVSNEINQAIVSDAFSNINWQNRNSSKDINLQALSNKLMNQNVSLTNVVSPLRGTLNRKYDAQYTMLAQALEIYDTIFHYHADIINHLREASNGGTPVALTLVPQGTGLGIAFANILNPDTFEVSAGTPLANTGFVDTIRAAQAGTPTPNLNDPSVTSAKRALDQAKQQLSADQQALVALQNGQLPDASKAHNDKLASLKSAYDAAIKSANDVYNKAISEAKAKLNAASTNADKTYNDTIAKAKSTRDNAVKKANDTYAQAIKDATNARDLKIKEANGDPNYVNDLKKSLETKYQQRIKDDQAKIDSINAERQAKLDDLKKSTDAKTNDQVQEILAKYGVSDAQIAEKVKPYLDDIKSNKEKLAELQRQDAIKAQQLAAQRQGHYQIGNANIALPVNNAKAENGREAMLPQTGSHNSFAVVALGVLTAMFGLGLSKKREY